LAGIGVGPANLSLAALLAPISRIRARFFERRAAFAWHPGMMLPGARMQTSFLKDVVTPVSSQFPRDDQGNLCLSADYSVAWPGAPSHRIYMQNAGRYSHGVGDAQLSLAAWRSAVIVNSLVGSEVYPTSPCASPVQWSSVESEETRPGIGLGTFLS